MTFVEELQALWGKEERQPHTQDKGSGKLELQTVNFRQPPRRSSLRRHTTTIKVMLDPLLGLMQHQQTLLKRLVVRIWPRLVQKQVRQHGIRWLRLSLQLHRHQNFSLLLLRKSQSRMWIVATVQMPSTKNIQAGQEHGGAGCSSGRNIGNGPNTAWRAPTSQSLNECGPFWARCSPQRRRQISCRWTWIWWWGHWGIANMSIKYGQEESFIAWTFGQAKLLGWKWQALGCSRVR